MWTFNHQLAQPRNQANTLNKSRPPEQQQKCRPDVDGQVKPRM